MSHLSALKASLLSLMFGATFACYAPNSANIQNNPGGGGGGPDQGTVSSEVSQEDEMMVRVRIRVPNSDDSSNESQSANPPLVTVAPWIFFLHGVSSGDLPALRDSYSPSQVFGPSFVEMFSSFIELASVSIASEWVGQTQGGLGMTAEEAEEQGVDISTDAFVVTYDLRIPDQSDDFVALVVFEMQVQRWIGLNGVGGYSLADEDFQMIRISYNAEEGSIDCAAERSSPSGSSSGGGSPASSIGQAASPLGSNNGSGTSKQTVVGAPSSNTFSGSSANVGALYMDPCEVGLNVLQPSPPELISPNQGPGQFVPGSLIPN